MRLVIVTLGLRSAEQGYRPDDLNPSIEMRGEEVLTVTRRDTAEMRDRVRGRR